MPGQGGIQFLPGTYKKVEIKTPGGNGLFVLGILLALIAGGFYFGLVQYQNNLKIQVTSLDDELIALEGQQDKTIINNLQNFSKQSAIMSNYLSGHVFWTQALDKISSMVLNQVQAQSISANMEKKTIEVKATALNYAAIARQLAAFNNGDGVLDATVGSMTTNNNGRMDFNILIKLDEAKFLKKK